ncbi:c-type cytochrome biogenesis protein CcmI [Ferrovum sp.]|uniref:c-type cytochrome biogenesis protein CcmI n=1 Tax=Ferrovum sp. TaxID=2609467 RepID=UPI0026282BC0|nr:c-type cytochrome biogenesis protein CcmI [Ferrovum sp.]
MTVFILVSGGLTLLILCYLVFSLIRRGQVSDHRKALNAAVYRDQLQELAAEKADGSLADQDYDQAREEVERRLLEDTAVTPEVTDRVHGRRTALLLLALIPLASIGMYLWRGHPEALDLQPAEMAAPAQQMTPAKINEMVKALAEKLAKNPDNPQGWAMLGRSYMNLDKPGEAVKAFGHLKKEMVNDPELMVDYAEALAADAQVRGDDKQMIESNAWVMNALKLEPGNGKGLFMAGSFAYITQQYAQAVSFWSKLMPLLDPSSQDSSFVLEQLNKARAQLKLAPVTAESFAGPEGPVKPQAQKGAAASSISGEVTLDPALKDKITPGETLFIFAKAVQGPPMPLAVIRTSVGSWPLKFQLTDAQAMSPQFNLSSVDLVRVEVRVTQSGNPMPSSGDLFGATLPLKPGAHGVELVINQVQP